MNAPSILAVETAAGNEPHLAEEGALAAPNVAVFNSEGRMRAQADILVDIGCQHALFSDRSGIAYAQVQVGEHAEVQAVDSTAYREVLARAYFELVKKGCRRNIMSDALLTLSSIARFNDDTRTVWLRVAAVEEKIVIDLGDADRQCIEVDSRGWRWCAKPPMFRRAGAPLALPKPAWPDFHKFWRYANVRVEHRPLVAGYMLAALRPRGPYPHLHLSGEQGTGKSTLARAIKAVIDPSMSALRAPPKDVRDLLVAAHNGWCLALDNISFLNPQLSDSLCRLATGGAISERQLYTNVEEVLIEVQRPAVLNGIEDLATRPDLAERGIHVELEVIEQRMSEQQFWKEFEKDAPHIFGALLQGLSLAIRNHKSINIGRLPRMADFVQWAAAGMPALGFTAAEFLDSYRENREDALSAGVESSSVGRALVAFMSSRTDWSGTAADLLAVLSGLVDESTARSLTWPKSPRGLSGAIRRLAPALRTAGLNIETERATDASRTRTIRVCRREKEPSKPSILFSNQAKQDVSDDSDGENHVSHNAFDV